jgi:hypothetical protein
MSNENVKRITNDFLDARLVSLASWRQAAEISPKDRNGPYVVLQKGYDPEDVNMTPGEFVLGRAGKWLPLPLFYKLPVPERRAEFLFGTAAEVMQLMTDLPSKPIVFGSAADRAAAAVAPPEGDEMAAAIQQAKAK